MASTRQTALITGGAKRLGRAIAVDLAKQGYDIALHYNSSEASSEIVADEIRSLGVQCESFQADLSDHGAVEKLVPAVLERMPSLSVLVNSASIYDPTPIAETSIEILQQNFSIHLVAPFLLSRDFFNSCPGGNIINIVDTKVHFQQYDYAAYLLSKKSLAELTKMSALEFAPKVRVNAILPGVILPPEGRGEDYIEWRRHGLPLQRIGNPTHISHTVRYILENDFLTGQMIALDGGESLTAEGRSVIQFEEPSGE
ncbi:MAG: SDR family oxidoreductase [Planctomycetota bacterium]|nr:SDR family oxidoreductase [Planctomycetota bacterium]